MMRRTTTLRLPPLYAWLIGAFIGILSFSLLVGSAWAAPGKQSAAGHQPALQAGTPAAPEAGAPTDQPKECAECHPDVNDAWIDSSHAHAYDNQAFSQRWESLGEPGECLLCHTTGYQAATGEYSAEGVTCEACHGQMVEGHPPAAVPIRSDAEYCGTCHTQTLGEWRLTGHSGADVGCTDCHNPHSQQALFENPDEMCINCHKDDIQEHQNDLHIQKGIGCSECHMLVIPPETPPADGLAPTGHSFTISSVTCVVCHTDTLHIGKPFPGYEEGAKTIAAGLTISPTLPTVVAAYTGGHNGGELHAEGQIQALEAALASARLSTLFQGGIIGLVLGGTTVYLVARNARRRAEEDFEVEEASEAASGTEHPHE